MKIDEREMLKKSMTKKQLKIRDNRDRIVNVFNTGTRTHKSPFDYDRQAVKKETKELENAD